MNKQDATTKLASTEASLKRWQTRLKRAITKVNELDRQRRRLQQLLLTPNQKPPKKGTVRTTAFEIMTGLSPAAADVLATTNPEKTTSPPPGSMAEKYKARDHALVEASKTITLDIPDFCNRADPHIAAKMTEARKKAEAEERKKMPLVGRAALDAIRKKK